MVTQSQYKKGRRSVAIDVFSESWFWGISGAFCYAATRLNVCLTSPKPGESPVACVLEFLAALVIGGIGAAAFAPWFCGWRHMTEPRDLNAVAVIFGLLANPTAPTLITFAPRMASTILAAMKGPKDEP